MNFIDKVKVSVVAGDGGKGHVSFRHEKFIDKGGPDGGDAGKGGNIVFVGSRNQNTLAAFRFQRELRAEPGKPGGKRNMHGRNGKDLVVAVPVGTIVHATDGSVIADLVTDGQEAIVAKGGRGGFGNAHFTSSVRQAPNFAEKGEPGDAYEATLELKVIADVGLVGQPNAGKSTLLGRISNARPEIADYPFTTLVPNLGVVDVDKESSLLFADIPGLIEGAAEGKGLGHEFLRHIERTAVLVHLIDAYQDDVAATYITIQDELKAYTVDLTDRPQVVVLNKVEGLDQEMIDDLVGQLRAVVPKGTHIFAISATAGSGIPDMLRCVRGLVTERRKAVAAAEPEIETVPVLRLADTDDTWRITQTDEGFVVTGVKIERFARRTEFENEEALQRFRDIMRRMGILQALTKQGIDADQQIIIGSPAVGKLTY